MCAFSVVSNSLWSHQTVAHQAFLSMEFSRQEYWSGLPFSLPGALLAQVWNPHLLHLLHWQVDFFTTESPGNPNNIQSAPQSAWHWGRVLSHFSYVWLFVTLWPVTHQDPLSMEFSREEQWNQLPCLLHRIFLTQGSNPHFLSHLHLDRWILYH